MGGHVSRADFEWSYTEEPHASRRTEILKKYPEIKKLMVVDHAVKYKAIALMLLQFVVMYLVKDLSWGIILLLAYTIAGVANHGLLLAIHEACHNNVFGHGKLIQSKLFSIFINLPIGVPCAISFKKYHVDHHKYMGNEGIDVDLPTKLEARLFTNCFSKFIWVVCQGLFYSLRPLVVRPLPVEPLEALNIVAQLAFDIAVFMVLGPKSLAYVIAGTFMGMGLHPVAGHFISEHYLYKNGFETYSYYGPLNMVTFNIGYHNEHHDFPNIPCSLLPKVREIAPEYYNSIPSHNSWIKVLIDFIRDPAIGPYARMKRKNNLEKDFNSGNLKLNGGGSEINGKIVSNGIESKVNGHLPHAESSATCDSQPVNGHVGHRSALRKNISDEIKPVNGHIQNDRASFEETDGNRKPVVGHVKND